MSKPAVIACVPCDKALLKAVGYENYNAGPGAIQTLCPQCTQPMWLGKKSQEYRALWPDDTEVICMICLMKSGRFNPAETKMHSLGGNSTLE